MTSSLHQQANALLYKALEQAAGARPEFLKQACHGRPDLFEAVNSMLSHIDQLDAFLEEPLALASTPAVPVAELRPQAGEALGGWRVVRELQRGRLGAIMLVERSGADGARQIAALKIVDDDALSLEDMALFHRQRQLLATLTHPDIARLIDGGSLPDGRPFFVVEYSDGIPVDEFCAEANLPARARIALFQRVWAAVHHAHQRLVAHRHLHPSNILVDRGGALKVSDFGIASLLDEEALGPFASPEQLEGLGVSTSSDIYALGEVLRALFASTPAGLSGDLLRIALMACATDPAQRHASADALARDVQRYLDRRPIMAAHTSGLRRTGLLMRRHPLASAAAALVLLATGVGAAVGWHQLATDPQLHRRVLDQIDKFRARPAIKTAVARAAADEPPRASSAQAQLEPGNADAALSRLREALSTRVGEGDPRAIATARIALADALVKTASYAEAETEFMAARTALAGDTAALAEIDLARAYGFYLRKHGKTAGQIVRALRVQLAAGGTAQMAARAALLEALIQPGGTAARAYAAAQKALPVVLAGASDRDAAMAWRQTGEIGLRADQKDTACGYLDLAEARYVEMERGRGVNALDQKAREQLSELRKACQ